MSGSEIFVLLLGALTVGAIVATWVTRRILILFGWMTANLVIVIGGMITGNAELIARCWLSLFFSSITLLIMNIVFIRRKMLRSKALNRSKRTG